MKKDIGMLMFASILLATTALLSYRIHKLEYKMGKLVDDVTTNSRKVTNDRFRIDSLEDLQDVRFLRMRGEANFYGGDNVEVWRMKSKKRKK